MNASPQNDGSQVRGPSRLWIGLLPPLGWFAYLLVNYMLVPRVCAAETVLPLYIATVVALLTAAIAGVVAWRIWQQIEPEWPDEAGGVIPRSRFLAVLGLLSSGLFFLVILAQGIPTLILHPCYL